MTISPTHIAIAKLYISENGTSTLHLTNTYQQTSAILVPEYLTTLLQSLFEARLNSKAPTYCISDSLRTGKKLHQDPNIFLARAENIGSYFYKIRKMIRNPFLDDSVTVGTEDFIVSKQGWGYSIHPDIRIELYNQNAVEEEVLVGK